MRGWRLLLIGLLVLLLGCNLQEEAKATPSLTVQQTELWPDSGCSGQFVARELPHVTGMAVERIGFFYSNGSGVAVNDLDNDGDLDIVMGNLLGPNQIFWNGGGWYFRPSVLFEGSARAVTAVDVDGDSLIDIVIATRNGDVRFWRNLGNEQFVEERLIGVTAYAYSLDWGDIDQDGDLDLLTASYDASLAKQTPLYQESHRAGVSIYLQADSRFYETKLTDEAQALTAQFADLNADGRLDILIGNDFDLPDYVWLYTDDGFVKSQPFTATTMSTMSFAWGDVDNNGRAELFASDMHPYSDAPDIMAQWQPVMDNMMHDMMPGDVQQMSNVLQVWGEDGTVQETAVQRGISASGWTWSSQFGDLDQDGFLDLYVVNGMQAMDNFSHLPNDELVEENQAYRNDGNGNFVPMPDWHLNSTYGGRSMVMTDFDWDGDLDIVINNLQDPAQLFENQLCTGENLLVDVRWPQSSNPYAIGTTLILHTSTGSYQRLVQVSSGYLSSQPARTHFGFPADSELQSLQIIWPDGTESVVEDLQKGNWMRITR